MKIADNPKFDQVWQKTMQDMEQVLSLAYRKDLVIESLEMAVLDVESGLANLVAMAKNPPKAVDNKG